MEKEFLEIIRDYIQDTRANTIMEIKYDALIYALIDNARLNYTHNNLRIDEYSTIITLLKSFEPKKYNKKFTELLEAENERLSDDEIPF